MPYLEDLLPEFRKGAKIRRDDWSKGTYIFMDNDLAKDSNGCLFNFNLEHLFCNDWEFYQEHIAWEYIIKNKCLCWFWDEDDKFFMIGILLKISKPYDQFKDYKYKDKNGRYWENCRPVRRDEVNFYEEK